jgi:hypothetical protein
MKVQLSSIPTRVGRSLREPSSSSAWWQAHRTGWRTPFTSTSALSSSPFQSDHVAARTGPA